jgi:hypothetical protein
MLCPTAVSLRGATNGRDAAIHRVSKYAYGECGSVTGSQWIATPFRLAMTRREDALPHGSVIARSERSEGRGNPSCLEGRVRGMRFAYWFTVDRHGLRPRDDKAGVRVRGDCREPVDRHAFQARDDKAHTLSLRGATNGRDAAIHRVSQDAYGVCGSLSGSQWIATGYALAMTRQE